MRQMPNLETAGMRTQRLPVRIRRGLAVCFCGLMPCCLGSCLVAPRMPDPPATHPASPEAMEAPAPPRSRTLALPAPTAEKSQTESTNEPPHSEPAVLPSSQHSPREGKP